MAKIPVRVFGRAAQVSDPDTPFEIWDGARPYVFLTEASDLYVASTDNADAGNVVVVHGLNENYDTQVRIVTLDGQNPVKVPGAWLRLYFLRNANHGTAFEGSIYIATTSDFTDGVPDDGDKVQAICSPDLQHSANSMVAVPQGFKGKLLAISASIIAKNPATPVSAKIGVFSRPWGRTFVCAGYFGLSSQGVSLINLPIRAMNSQLVSREELILRVISMSSQEAEITANIELELEKV